MTEPNRYAVPLDRLEGVRVAAADQVQEQPTPPPDGGEALWGGALAHGGDGPDGDGD
jgi:hypothetical protein